jgi:hypothetical protein
MARACTFAVETLEARRLLSSVTQYHNDSSSDGENLSEISLTPSNVNASTFGKLFATRVDGPVYAQPLYVPSVGITVGSYQGTHNVTFVATQNDSLYAIDANNGTILWQDSFLVAEAGLANVTAVSTVSSNDVNSTDIAPNIGITGTPVIDAGFLYVAALTKQIVSNNTISPHFVFTLYKVNIDNGSSTSTVIGDTTYDTGNGVYTYNSGPYVLDPDGQGAGVVKAVVNGASQNVIYFNALRANNRSALTVYNGSVYVSFASHGDNGPYHGWILGYSESSLTPTAVFNTDPDGSDSGIWMGGGQIAIDSSGFMYIETGNGTFDTTLNVSGFPMYGDYGDSFIKIQLDSSSTQTNQNINGWGLAVVDYFTPQDQASLSSADQDLGSGAPMLLPVTAGSITIGKPGATNLLVGSGKGGTIYLINTATSKMGEYNGTTDKVVQEIGGGLGGGGSFGSPSFYYNGTTATIYYMGLQDNLRAFTIANGMINTTPAVSPDTFGLLGATASISANGDSDGIVWGIDGGTNELRAYNATNVAAGAIYSTATNSSRDALGSAVKFTVPTVVDGEVFAGTTDTLVAYGLLAPPTSPPTAPTTLQATAVSNFQINLSWNDTASNAFGYYVEESGNGGANWTQIATLGSSAVSYGAVGLQPNTTYSFRVRAYNSLGDSGYTNVQSATTTNNAVTINYSGGFAGETGLTANGSAQLNGSALELTDGGGYEASSVFSNSAVSVQGFSTSFSFQLVNPNADGITFTLQGIGPTALGQYGGALGFAGISNSVAIKFDLYDNNGEGTDSTGLFVNGDQPSEPMSGDNPIDTSIDMTSSGVNLHSGDVMQVNLNYDGATLTETITDAATEAAFSHSYAVNIPSFIGSGYGYAGFTAGTGGATATQNILNWTYTAVAAKPYSPTNLTVTPASGTELDLNWSEPYSAVSNFNILQLISGVYSQIGQVNGAVTTFPSTGLSVGGTYSYEVVASNPAGSSLAAGPITGTTPTPPANPINLQTSNITTSGVTLTWQDVATNATGYEITRQLESNNSQYVTTLPANATSFTDSKLISGGAYQYEVAAINLAGPSAGISTTIETVPPAPVVSPATGSVNQITLNWTDTAHVVTGYNIYRGTTPGGENYSSPINGSTPVTGTSYIDSAPSSSTYYYTVEAATTGGSSTASNEVNDTVVVESFAVASGSTLEVNLSAAGPITLAASGSTITATQNSVQVSLSGFTGITVTDTGSGDVLNINGTIPLPVSFTNCGSSTVNVNSGALTFAAVMGGSVNLGTLSIAGGASAVVTPATTNSPTTLVLGTLSLGSTSTLDLSNNVMLINYGAADPIAAISAAIRSGYANGGWNGYGIISSTVQTHPGYGLGYADAVDARNPAGLSAGQLEVKFTLLGDANLDGKVNATDFGIVAAEFGKTVSGWDMGDFNYDGSVNGTDFGDLSANFGKTAQIAVTPGPEIAMAAAVITNDATPTISVLHSSKVGGDKPAVPAKKSRTHH